MSDLLSKRTAAYKFITRFSGNFEASRWFLDFLFGASHSFAGCRVHCSRGPPNKIPALSRCGNPASFNSVLVIALLDASLAGGGCVSFVFGCSPHGPSNHEGLYISFLFEDVSGQEIDDFCNLVELNHSAVF